MCPCVPLGNGSSSLVPRPPQPGQPIASPPPARAGIGYSPPPLLGAPPISSTRQKGIRLAHRTKKGEGAELRLQDPDPLGRKADEVRRDDQDGKEHVTPPRVR